LNVYQGGVGPGFNWNGLQIGRNTPALQQVITKTRTKIPEQFDNVVKTLLTDRIVQNDYHDFIENSFAGKLDQRNTTPVGIFDRKITGALKKKGIDLEEQGIIVLESKLIHAGKYAGRHTKQNNAPSEHDWYKLMDYLIDADVFLDRSSLIYLRKLSESKYMKIVIDLDIKPHAHRGAAIKLPKVDTMYELDISTDTDRGSAEYNRIMKLEKIR
jgi:hypothetical protein